jgi:tricorn protease
MRAAFALATALINLAHAADTSTDGTRLLHFPDISATQVTFVYGGDIYTVARTGGTALRLTGHAGKELFPKFSPDGTQIAFSAEYSGTRQVFVMPSDGSGAPKQLTWYNDVGAMPPRGGYDYRVLDWTPDGKNIVVRMNRLGVDERAGRPFYVPAAGGDEIALAVPETGGGMLSPDGTQFVYTPIDREFRTWKRTRGGRAQDVWVYDLARNTSTRLTQDRATDNQPMWLSASGSSPESVFFTSDRNYTLNLFQISLQSGVPLTAGSGEAKQMTFFKDFDVLWPSAGGDSLVFENGGWLYTFQPSVDAEPTKLSITVLGDQAQTLPSVKNVTAQIESSDISMAGERAIFAARGELFSVPRKAGVTRNLTNTPNAREMSVALSPDGKTLAYLSDASGEYELYLAPSGGGTARQLTRDGRAWRLRPTWAPDNQSLLIGDAENRLYLYDLNGRATLVDQATRSHAITDYVYSPDARNVVYVKANATSMDEIWWYQRATGRKQRVLGGQFDATSPAFDPAGRYLYFVSNREHTLVNSSLEFNYLYANSARIFATTLSDGAPPLIAPKSDEIGQNAKVEPAARAGTDKALAFELDGMQARAQVLPMPGASYPALAASVGGLYFVAQNALAQTPAELRFYDALSGKAG